MTFNTSLLFCSGLQGAKQAYIQKLAYYLISYLNLSIVIEYIGDVRYCI